MKLQTIRKLKSLFMKWKAHKIVRPFEHGLINLAYMSKLSKWRSENQVTKYNDWYQQDWDYNRRFKIYETVIEKELKESEPVDYMEFGVSAGNSFRWWLERQTNAEARFFGFDTFEGLPEAFGPFGKGEMAASLESINITDPRATFYKGLFQDTLVEFLDGYKSNHRKIIHLDADIFSATIFVLSQLYKYLNDGDIIMFDEFAVPTHEFRAFQIFVDSFYINYEVIAAANNYLFLAIKIKK